MKSFRSASLVVLCPLFVGCFSNGERDAAAEGDAVAHDTAVDAAHDAAVDSVADSATGPDGSRDTGEPDVVEPEGEPGLEVSATSEGATAPFVKLHATITWDGHEVADIAAVRWTVLPPLGAARDIGEVTGPSLDVEANLVGTWRVRAVIVDRDGNERVARSFTIQVAPPIGLYVQLSWRTPGDVNENDTGGDQIYFSVGTDVDLHLLHYKANGEFFDWTYDAYWDNTQPEWGIFDSIDNPSLDRDDTDGAGPEAISLAVPEPDAPYTVGVHYWNDWGYGNAWATVRVYVDGELADEWADVELSNDDMWTSHRITNGVVERVGSAPSILPNYKGVGSSDEPPAVHCTPEIIRDVPGRLECSVQYSSVVADSIRWNVDDPSRVDIILEDATGFVINVDQVGWYKVTATLLDSSGGVLSTPSTTVYATTQPSLRLTLVWSTPGDPDPLDVAASKGDAAGADLDLHLLHAKAEGLGDFPYDCGYDNGMPEWGVFGALDNPRLIADDFDGVGPETILLGVPESGVAYRVLVHVFDDHGFGPSTATVRLYADDVVVGRAEAPALSTGDTWEAMTVIDGVVQGGGP